MPPSPAATGATAAPIRPAPAEVLAKADVIAAKPEVRHEPAPVPAKESSPVIVTPSAPAAPAAAANEPPRRKGIVSMFISLKERRLYVRQNMEPLFSTPVTIARPDRKSVV